MDSSLDPLLCPLRAIALRRWGAELILRRDVRLQDPACSVVRGLVGDRFRATRCSTGAAGCDGCEATEGCDFARAFGASGAGVAEADPRPFWLRGVPADERLSTGTTVHAELITLAGVTPSEPMLAAAFYDALSRLGADALARHTLRILPDAMLPWTDAPSRPARAWRITALTPLRIQGDPARSRENCPALPWLASLASAGIRRVADLVARYGGGMTAPRVRMPSLREVRVERQDLRAWRGSRFSQRQQKRIALDGMLGSIDVTGIDALVALLRVLERTSVGKSTALGFGSLRVDPIE